MSEAKIRAPSTFHLQLDERSSVPSYVECDITDPVGKLIAKATSACTVLRGDQANAR